MNSGLYALAGASATATAAACAKRFELPMTNVSKRYFGFSRAGSAGIRRFAGGGRSSLRPPYRRSWTWSSRSSCPSSGTSDRSGRASRRASASSASRSSRDWLYGSCRWSAPEPTTRRAGGASSASSGSTVIANRASRSRAALSAAVTSPRTRDSR